MKKVITLICLIFLVGCSSASQPEATPAEDLQAQITEKDNKIATLENQVQDLTDMLSSLQGDYDELQAASSSVEPLANDYLCPVQLDNMRYQNTVSAIAIVEGWFALQDKVQELRGTYSTTFWDGVESRIHTIRYINADTGLSTTTSFMIFFEEADWSEGLLWLTEQCWLDFPE